MIWIMKAPRDLFLVAVSIFVNELSLDIAFDKKRERHPDVARKPYLDAVYEIQHMYELSGEANLHPNKKMRVLGHFKNHEMVSWETKLPRDNMAFCVSETQNLKHIDS